MSQWEVRETQDNRVSWHTDHREGLEERRHTWEDKQWEKELKQVWLTTIHLPSPGCFFQAFSLYDLDGGALPVPGLIRPSEWLCWWQAAPFARRS